jgi:hypothetical protein
MQKKYKNVKTNSASNFEMLSSVAQTQPQQPVDTDGYVSPMVVTLGNLSSVRSNAYGTYYDGPNTEWLRN